MGIDIFDMYDELISRNNIDDSDDVEELISGKEYKQMMAPKDLNGVPVVNPEIEEELIHFKRYNKNRKQHKYSEKELEVIRESCRTTIVNDYSEKDIYHMSDEERANEDSLQELSVKLGSLKRVYRKIDQYIEAQRIVFDAWCLLEEKENILHSKEEFFKLVHDGRIYSNRIIQPQYKGKDKYDDDIIISYVSNKELDPKNLIIQKPKVYDPWLDNLEDDESEEEKMYRLLSPEEAQFIVDMDENNLPLIEVKPIKKKYLKNINARRFGKKKKKKNYKTESIHRILNKIQSNPANNNHNQVSLTGTMFDIEEDNKIDWNDFRYNGSLLDDAGMELYEIRVNMAQRDMRLPGSSYRTIGGEIEREMYKEMEEGGINTLIIRRSDNTEDYEKTVTHKIEKKKNKKLERSVLLRLTNLNANPKFMKLTAEAEKDLNEYLEDDDD